MVCQLFIINFLFIYPTVYSSPTQHQFRNTSLNKKQHFSEIVAEFSYKTEEYKIITEDSYILTLFHVPGEKKPPILLVHGFLDSSDTWVIRGEDSLGITLARRGYDVWFANCRGNYYTRSHVYLDPDKDEAFWDYSFHNIGYYDLPATIDTVLSKTREKKLNIIGHSQGNTVVYVLTSTRPEYNEKINVAIALSPICYFHHVQPPLSILIRYSPFSGDLIKSLDLHEFFGYNSKFNQLFRAVCSIPNLGYTLCTNGFLFLLCGFDPEETEMDFYMKSILYFPAGTSSKSVIHFEQVGSKKVFANFDYGRLGNIKIYNAPTPPVYNLSNVKVPVVLLAAKNDFLSTIPDVELLKSQLPNNQYVLLPRAKMNHNDFVWGRNAKKYLFPYIFKALQKYRTVS